jgi:FkbM family methyltransferase
MRALAWLLWEHTPEGIRRALRPALASIRRRRRLHTPMPPGKPPPLPAGAVELDTAIGTLWFDADDVRMTPWIRRQGVWEADVMKVLVRALRPGGVFVDVGANVGFHTVLAAKLVAPDGSVYAVEPAPWTLELLQANVWRSGVDVTVVAKAASDRPGRVRLGITPQHRSGARLTDDGDCEVESARLDDLLPEIAVDVVKIDVEGSEPMVLRGAQALIERSPHLLAIVEFRAERHLSGETPTRVLDCYESLGFELCALRRNGVLEPVSADELLARAATMESLNIALRRTR